MQYRWRVSFRTPGIPSRDVIASTEEAAKRTAIYAERLTGNKVKRLRAGTAEKLFAVGYRATEAATP